MFFLLATIAAQTQAATKTVSMESFSSISGNVNGDANISYEAAKGTASTAPSATNGEIRVYQNGGTFTIKATNGVTITKIVLGSSMATTVSYSVDGSDPQENLSIGADATTTVNGISASQSVKFTCLGTDKNSRLYVNYLAVTYESSKNLTGITVKTPPTTVSYTEGEKFNPAGLVITASYDNSTSEDITYNETTKSSFTFNPSLTTPLATTDNSVSISYGGKTTNQAITVSKFSATAGTYDIVPNNVFFGCNAFTTKPSDFTSATGSSNGITIEYVAASSAYINSSQCRMYSGTKMNFSAPDGFVITAISFTADGTNWAGTHTASTGTMTNNKNWAGSAEDVTITFAGSCRCTNISVTIAQSSSKTATTTAFAVETVTKTVGDADFTEAATLAPAGAGSLTYSSSNTDVATVDNAGLVHIVGAGTTTIKAEFTGNAEYEASSDSYALTVNAAPAATYTVTISQSENGTISVKHGDADVTSGDKFAEGEKLMITATPAEGYKLSELLINGIKFSSPKEWTMGKADVTISATFEKEATPPTPVGDHTFDFTKLNDWEDWSSSYSKHEITNSYGTVTLASANKQTSTITDMPVTKGGDVTFVATKGKVINSLKFTCEQWTTKAQTITLNVSSDGGTTWNATSTTSNNFELSAATLPENVNAVKFTFSSSSNQVGIKYLDLVLGDPTTPTPTVAAPVVTPESGLQTAGFKVTASCATTGAKIYYKYNDGDETEYTAELNGQAGTYKFWATLDVEGGETLTSDVVERTYTIKALTGITLSGYQTALNVGDEFTFGGIVYATYEGSTEKVNVTKDAVFGTEEFNKDLPGTYTITVSYTEDGNTQTATYDVKVVDVFNIIIAQPANGTLVVKNNANGDVINSGDKVPVGTVLKVEATPATGYAYNFWQVYTDKHTITKYPGKETETYTLDAKNIKSEARAVFQANFREVETFTYSWYANGELVGTTNEGEEVTVPTAPAKLGDKDFMGWVTTSTVDPNNAPTYVDVDNLSSPTSNKKFYAVYATKGSTTGNYYEKVPSDYTDWTNGEYILVYEESSSAGKAYDGKSTKSEYLQEPISVSIERNESNNIIRDKKGAAVITIEQFNETHLRMRINGETDQIIGSATSDNNGLQVVVDSEKTYSTTDITYGNDNRWWIRIGNSSTQKDYYKYLQYSSDSFRAMKESMTAESLRYGAVWFYKKVAGYSGFTTGVDAGKGEFKLVKSTADLINGREYIIVSKHDSGIYGLSIDDADSRQNTKYDDEGQEIPITEGKTSKDHRRAVKDVTLYNDDEYASINGKTSVLTLGGAAGAWKFNSAAGYLTMPKEDACLQLSTTPSTAIVSVDENSKSVVKFNATTKRYIFLNFNDGYPRFSTYSTDANGWQYGKDIYLYYREALNEETLAEIEANGIDGTQYTISDELEVVRIEHHTAWVKDNAPSYAFRENTYGAQYFNNLSSYDQSNWIQLNLSSDAPAKGSILTGVKGTYNGYKDRKHELNNVTYTVVEGKTGSYRENLNTYTMGSFWDDNIYDYVYVAETGKKFFFMNPKIMEVCTVTDAIWAGDNTFVVPAKQKIEEKIEDSEETQTIYLNQGNFNGTFVIGDWSHNASSENDVKAALNQDQYKGARYSFEIVVYKQDNDPNASAGAPAKVAGKTDMGKQTSYFMAIPLNMQVSPNIVTEVDDVNAVKSVKSVRYYNVAGHAFDEAQPGINIVVTEYTDGSHTAAKVLR